VGVQGAKPPGGFQGGALTLLRSPGAWPARACCYFSGENAVSLILSTTTKVMTAAAMR